MQFTTQTRPVLDERAARVLDAHAQVYGSLLHKLYASVAREGGSPLSHKTAFCRTHQISSRFFNALRSELGGLINGTRELLKNERKELEQRIRKYGQRRAASGAKLTEVANHTLRMSPAAHAKLGQQHHYSCQRLDKLKSKLLRVKSRLAANVPGICFGSRKLFQQQHYLELTRFATNDKWLDAWRASRAHQWYFLGSKDETAGNQACTLVRQPDGRYSLRVRLLDRLLSAGESKYLVIPNVEFAFDGPAVADALERNIALSYRFHKDARGWRIFLSFDHTPAERSTLGPEFGVVGIDLNADYLAVTETDPQGNLLESRRFDFATHGTTGAREDSLSRALQEVVEWAVEKQKPIAAEELDFTAKKRALRDGGASAAQARMLSGLIYAKYQQLLEAKCFRAGVELIKVEPAYTSVIGRIKYAGPRGLSVHAAAAGVIARRGQKLSERIPRAGAVSVPAQGRHYLFPLPARTGARQGKSPWADVSTALRTFLREQWLAARRQRRSAKVEVHRV